MSLRKRYDLFLMLFIGIPGLASADEVRMALTAMQSENYQYSASVWSRLSQQGNVIAEYNLALSLEKMPGRQHEETNWLKNAARERLITAYHRLQSSSVKPDRLQRSLSELAPEDWVQLQNPKNYTLQVASSKNLVSIENYYENNQLSGKAGYYKYTRDGEIWYTLIYGSYSSASEARKAIVALPSNLQKWKPWVRNIKDVHRIMQPIN